MKTSKKPELLKVAYVSKAHGIKGEILVLPFNVKAEWPQSIKEIFIGNSSFSVKNYRYHKKGIIFQLNNGQSRQEAELLKFQPVFLPKKLFKSKKGEKVYLAELISFSVEVSGQGEIGIVQSFQSVKHQDFLLVQHKGASAKILIPFVESYIKVISFSKKRLVLDLPKNYLKIFKYTDPV